ncbi:MAG: ABC transporter permease [Myxococcales bacterium]|nr:ABC transporter permease [Myxococcales bacterium]MBP6848853.1 ABC transporter permease [Kofleriaceae bacterium]
MLRLIVSRLAGGVAVLAAVATITFLLLHAAPGGPFSRERRLQPAVQRNIEDRYHLHDPLWQQYGRYMSGLAKGDLGHSMKRPETVGAIIKRHFPYSLTLGLMAIGFAAVFGTLLGVLAAARKNTWVDYTAMSVALIGISIPSLVLGPIAIRYLALELGWVPAARADGVVGYLAPAAVLGLIYAGTIARLARASMIETLGADYIRTARAKGVSERGVVWRHGLRLGLLPVVSYLGPATAGLISGSFVVEKIFQIPGLGFYFVDSVTSRDYPVLTGLLVFYVGFLVLFNLLVDLAYGWIDPRIRHSERAA